jgi:transcriptional activator for dhaKLM operon
VEFTRLGKGHLLASQTASFGLIAIARPVMEDIYQCVQTSGTAIILTNSVGCILDWVGDEEVIQVMEKWGIGLGTIFSEELVGTTSFGLALAERMPVQVTGKEHFVQQFHVASGASAPMFDISGRLLGVLGLIMPADRYHAHSLGLVAAAARAVENQHQSDLLMAEQNSKIASWPSSIPSFQLSPMGSWYGIPSTGLCMPTMQPARCSIYRPHRWSENLLKRCSLCPHLSMSRSCKESR